MHKNRLYKYLIAAAIYFLPVLVNAETDIKVDSSLVDNSNISLRVVDPNIIDHFLADKAFRYLNNNEAEIGLWDQIKNWIWYNILRFIFSESTYPVIRIIYYLILIAIIIYFILRILKVDIRGLFYRKGELQNLIDSELLQNPEKTDIDEAISKSIEKGAYREAIRLLYLRVLKVLNSNNIISWSRDKTNSDYIKELKDDKMQEKFKFISFLFEYICYGEFMISKNRFEGMHESFNQFYREFNL